ncbi:MAG: aminotransferase class I/II-fold pyridoxal phosphate-dependent enzyme [Elusimicrobia bacterium]|nr:aminotransferase class I/II-fold pyridoxal phosphate-dependent enzyme [Elusimicrobiota bacterium]
MKLTPFSCERLFARHEFSARYLLCSSDCEGLGQSEALAMADAETARLWSGLRLGYTESQGLPLLREEIARLNPGCGPDDILVLAPEEGIFLAMNCLLSAGDRVVCTWPGYQSLYQIAESLGCAVDRWEPEPERWSFDLGRLEKALRPNTKLIVVNFPHNPTGALPAAAVFRRLIEIARRRGIALFSDEMYRFLELDAADRLPSAAECYEKAISLSGMSKAFGMAGVRIGWLATRDKELMQGLREFKDYTTICNSAPSEVLALIGLRGRERILENHLTRIRRNLALLDSFFSRRADQFRWTRPRAGTVAFPELLREDPDRLCEEAVTRAGVMLLPSSVYGYPRPHLRFGFGRENMPQALERFEAFLESQGRAARP